LPRHFGSKEVVREIRTDRKSARAAPRLHNWEYSAETLALAVEREANQLPFAELPEQFNCVLPRKRLVQSINSIKTIHTADMSLQVCLVLEEPWHGVPTV
jgi:hypothetical protein